MGADGPLPLYQVLVPGPTKIEYLFLSETQTPLSALEPGPETLAAINTHFWDWIWWITTKASIGREGLVIEHLAQLHAHLLRPLGVVDAPANIDKAVEAFLTRRDALEQEFGVALDRALEDEVQRGIDRVLRN